MGLPSGIRKCSSVLNKISKSVACSRRAIDRCLPLSESQVREPIKILEPSCAVTRPAVLPNLPFLRKVAIIPQPLRSSSSSTSSLPFPSPSPSPSPSPFFSGRYASFLAPMSHTLNGSENDMHPLSGFRYGGSPFVFPARFPTLPCSRQGGCLHFHSVSSSSSSVRAQSKVPASSSPSSSSPAISNPPSESSDHPVASELTINPLINTEEMKSFLHQASVIALRRKLDAIARPSITVAELLKLCVECEAATTENEAADIAKALDTSGSVFIFRGKVFLRPLELSQEMVRVLPKYVDERDTDLDVRQVEEEIQELRRQKDEIDMVAFKHTRRWLWGGLALVSTQWAIFFRLTYWELSWDVMEPAAFFCGLGTAILGYGYFLVTSSNPNYENVMKRLFTEKQKKMLRQKNFDVNRYLALSGQLERRKSLHKESLLVNH